MSARTRLAVLTVAASLLTACCGATASAYISGGGGGAVPASVAALEAPALEATAKGTAVSLSWSAVTPPGAGTVTYSVSRDGGQPGGSCPGTGKPGTKTSCTDWNAPSGAHTYTVTAYWRTWTAVSAAVEVGTGPGPAVSFAVVASTTNLEAGASQTLTITALDADGETATSYSGSHSLVFTGADPGPDGTAPTVTDADGAAVAFGSPTRLDFVAGVAVAAGVKNGSMRLYLGGDAKVEVSEGSLITVQPLTFAVVPAAPEALAFYGLEASSGTVGAPCLFTCVITGLGNRGQVTAAIAVTDEYGNVVEDLGNGHRARVSTTSGEISSANQSFPRNGPAIASRQFTFTAPSKGSFTATITASTSRGTDYADATATASR